jgi:diadenosine tetraphosphatase ApaH/serine/threonine PP2A family protein phosphatase
LADTDIFFGHWSTLSNITQPHVYPMDKGCAWGGAKDKDILVSLRGGKLLIGVKAEDGVFMVGDAEFVFEGQIKI